MQEKSEDKFVCAPMGAVLALVRALVSMCQYWLWTKIIGAGTYITGWYSCTVCM